MTEPTELVARLRELLAKTDSPNGHDWLYPWRVVPSDGKPIIASNRGGNLFRGFIGTWDEADLVVEAANTLPALLDLIEAQAAEIAALREALGKVAAEAFVPLDQLPDHDQPNGWRKIALAQGSRDLEFYMEQLRQRIGVSREETLGANIAKLSVRYQGLRYTDQAAQDRADKA